MSGTNNTQDAPSAQEELDSFVERFTEGLDPIVDDATDTPPATEPEKGEDQGSEQNSETAAKTEEAPQDKTETKNQQESSSEKTDPKEDEKKNENIDEVFTKSDKAFAELRTTNKSQGDLLLRMTRLAKLEAKNPAEAIKALSEQLDKIEAQHGNLTYDEVEKIRQSDKDQAEQKAQLRESAHKGFNELQRLHNLNDSDLVNFAKELKDRGVNPFEIPVDLVAQYRGMHYAQLMEAAKEAGRQEELARRAKAQTQATIPSNKQGGTENTGERLDSTEKLRAFLEN